MAHLFTVVWGPATTRSPSTYTTNSSQIRLRTQGILSPFKVKDNQRSRSLREPRRASSASLTTDKMEHGTRAIRDNGEPRGCDEGADDDDRWMLEQAPREHPQTLMDESYYQRLSLQIQTIIHPLW